MILEVKISGLETGRPKGPYTIYTIVTLVQPAAPCAAGCPVCSRLLLDLESHNVEVWSSCYY